ncbi:TetR/AcrR family transcriptional regulator [Bosea sp. (in: a-proteobacteria)]|uniref:TetR/AcrR family transcriptional regulator n=1 Tax=Bosea sp. (in: a-proteobacteria) TaxID=1871050 RepID=UPI001203F460|nr:TetR/AcrR family transcriptional regulator [Bosea sp. (in: a-proteobacteria)]TAJ30397.1 MAG: TetR/AcrR family transcriptional regulator [Bosea sp. (in: a-proteobacteria)]
MEASMRKPGGRPTREQAGVLEMQILEGARSVFCRSGFANASLEEIALRLGVSKHTIYRRFPNKAALLDAVVEQDLGRFRAALVAAAKEGSGALDALRRMAGRYVRIGSSRDYAAFYLSVSAEAALSATLRGRLAEWSRSALEPLVAALAEAQASGALRPGHTESVCDILVDLLEGANNRARLRRDAAADGEEQQALFEQRWAVFLAAFGTVPLSPEETRPGN